MTLQSGVTYVNDSKSPAQTKAYGFRDRPNQIPNQADTRFPTASFGKIFVAVGILQLIEQGLLQLDSTIGDLLSFDLHQIDPKVTIKQLLTHTSGVPDYCDEAKYPNYADVWKSFPNYNVRCSKDLLPLFLQEPMTFPRGERFEYNNSAFVLLDLIIEEQTGVPFDVYLQKHLFDKAQMSSTGYFELDRLPANCANAYVYDEATNSYYSNIYSVDVKGTGAGGAFTTVDDLDRFWSALLTGKLISKETLGQMLTKHVTLEDGGYGLGVWLDQENNPYIVGYDPGVNCVSHYDLQTQIQITVISNICENIAEVYQSLQQQ